MLATLEFIMVAALFADLGYKYGSKFVAWVKGEEVLVAADVKKVSGTVSADVSAVEADVKKVL
jgi:hypothetical protein